MAARVTAFVVIAIVAVTFVAGLIVGAQREDDSGPVDLIVYNARVYTGNPDARFAEAIAIRGNRIIRVGSNRDVKRLMRRATTVIDAHGGTVTAGFRDGSVDLKAGGLTLPPTALLPVGASPDPASGTTSGAAPASASAATSPAAASASAAASAPTSVSAQASAAGPASTAAQDPTSIGAETDTLDVIQQAIGHANTVGVTSVGVTARTPDDLLPYDTLLRTRELTARVNAALAAEWPLDEAAVARLDALRKRYEGVPLFKLKGIRLQVTDIEPALVTGRKKTARSGKTAGTAVAVAERKATELATERVEALSRTIALLEQHDWQIILETKDAGDATLALNAIEAALPLVTATTGATTATTPALTSKRRVRLEVQTALDKDSLARVARLNVIASAPKPSTPQGIVAAAIAQAEVAAPAEPSAPTQAQAPEVAADADDKAGAPQNAALLEAMTRPYANLLDSTVPFVLYSAWPVTPIDPRFALTLIMLDGVALAGENATPDRDTLTARLARVIDACTRYAAFATGDEEQQGTIAKEMLADLVIFSADLFALPADKLMDAEVTMTIFDGKVIYTRPEPTADTSSQ
jgi:predicted amidohydrolase YtcJ